MQFKTKSHREDYCRPSVSYSVPSRSKCLVRYGTITNKLWLAIVVSFDDDNAQIVIAAMHVY